ncbi:MAG: endopeptidase La [Clostridium sp.]
MDKNIKGLTMIPLRGITIFPNMVMHFDVGREKSIAALEKAMVDNQEIFLVAQKKSKEEDPKEDDIFKIGTVSIIKQILKLPGDSVRVLVEGLYRAEIVNYISLEPHFEVEVNRVLDDFQNKSSEDLIEIEALERTLRECFDEYIKLSGNVNSEALSHIEKIDNVNELIDTVSSYLILKQGILQEMLHIIKVKERLEQLINVILKENEILKVERKIGTKVKSRIDKSQKEYFLREQIKAIREELGEDDKEHKAYVDKIQKTKFPAEIKEKALYEVKRLSDSGINSSEGAIIKNYLDCLIDLPWNKITKDNLDIKNVRSILDEEHFGLKDVKQRIVEYLAVKQMSRGVNGPILCIVGPPGVGKTSIAKSIAKALNKNFVRMSLGGIRDESEIRGHRKTYLGAIPGRIIYGMKQAKSKNPLFLLDEIDKLSSDFRGNPADALLEVLDPQQNSTFRDHFLEVEFDLSKVMFITTANSLDTIPRPLLDRMEIIDISGYTAEEKLNICKKHLIPRKMKEYNISTKKITISDNAINLIIEGYTRESGIRSLERKIGSLFSKAITEILEKNKKQININVSLVRKYLGVENFSYDTVDKVDKVGVVTGLAWTAYGGDTLPIEVSVMKGTGKLELTGQLGEVMQESAKTAYSLVRSNMKKFYIHEEFYKTKDIHIHVPEGAVPKDGPSAGITITTAIVSALSNRKVKHDIAMTGEVTLTGRVLPIGGLKEKSLAAYRAGVNTIIISKANEKDLNEIPNSVKNKINYVITSTIEEVLENALLGEVKNDN